MKHSSKLFSAFLLGAATGALLSPEKGSELRKKLSRNAADLLDQLQDTISDGKEAYEDIREKIINKASALKEEMAEARTNREKSRQKTMRNNRRESRNSTHASER